MNNNKFNTLNDREWLRLTGIKKSTFNKIDFLHYLLKNCKYL
ncbi:hypothetical protein [Spiroplasma poulsonii]|nr:hypothetical protein [Spiroplasma poulsonii]